MNKVNFSFLLPTAIHFGRGIVSANVDLFSEYRRAFIVTGKHSGQSSGALDDIKSALVSAGVRYKVYDTVKSNPNVTQCEDLGMKARAFNADVVIGIGGGSPIDAAKAVAVFARNNITSQMLFNNEYSNDVLPVIAVPTTSGTGSEVTPWSVLTRNEKKTKWSFGTIDTFPKYAFIDPGYTDSLPDDITMNTAMDAFSHCFESFMSIKATPLTDMLNLQALTLFANCMTQIERGEFDELRETLSLISLLGGITISQTGTTIAHSMGYPLTYFHGVPHGAANSMIMPVYIKAMREYRPRRLEYALGTMKTDAAALIRYFKRNYPFKINLTDEMIELYAYQTSIQKSSKNTGIPCSRSDIEKMYWDLII